jgi:hypothetical protein
MRSINDLYQEDVHYLSESRAERSEVVRIETNREFNLESNSKSKSKSKSNHRNRHYSPDFTAIKKSQLSGSHASQKSYASYKSMGEKVGRKNEPVRSGTYNQGGYKIPLEYPSIPPLPISGKGKHPIQAYSPRPVNEISFGGSGYDIFGNEHSIAQLHQNVPFVPSSRRNSIRNVRRTIEEGRMNPTAVTFNYVPQPVSISAPEKQNAPNNQRTVGTMNSMSSFSKET